ncbi:sushi domain-containing protein 2 isoform X1 [Oryzias melastigma]|uniref:sushi domain-containing protein 2 isoform X1 n=1 Tax=Oryzias melastigma TaxID=30732 RepID=UPI00168D5A9E|nr:sushi domain-containing protein 2 isoform X1 [Oryzias melastigma]
MTRNTAVFMVVCGFVFIHSSESAGVTCRGRCGTVLQECSCRAACTSMGNCCADFHLSCIQVSPYSSCMLGGRALRILHLDPHPGGSLSCRFKGDIERKGFVDEDLGPFCVSPLLFETGWIQFDISTDGGDYNRSGEYLSVHPSRADSRLQVRLEDAGRWQNYSEPGQLQMTWDRSLLRAEKVNIELWGYREVKLSSGAENASTTAQLSYLYSIGRNVSNSGDFRFTPEPRADFSSWELGNIRITSSFQLEGERDVEGLWSPGHVLAWHLEQAFRDDRAAWAQDKCLRWDRHEETLQNFLEELEDCPCTLAQARADTGRFHTDYSCNLDNGSVCTYHPGSVHCVRGIRAGPSLGSGQQCCYDSSGTLVLTGDSAGGSTPDRAHDWGAPPYQEPPRVPGYSHWLYDVLSFHYCCLWSDHCNVYFHHRPSSGCRRYQPPRAGLVFGHLHFITFDGFNYTFNGKGEYHLLSSRDLSLQARTERAKLQNGSLAAAAQLSSVAMKASSSDVFEVRLADGRLQVLRNQKVLPFTENRWMDLRGAFVFAPTARHVSVMFSCGVGVEVHLNGGAPAATVLLPAEFSNHTQGLLGLKSADQSGGSAPPFGRGVSMEEMFVIGATWNISKTSSLFTYDSAHLLDSYYFPPSHDSAFVPAFTLPERPDDPLVADMSALCVGEGAEFCTYDTLVTRSLEKGNATLGAYRSHQTRASALEPVVSCGFLPAPTNGKKNGSRYLQGDTVSFSCDEGYLLFGSEERTCLEDGAWSGEESHCIRAAEICRIFVLEERGALVNRISLAAELFSSSSLTRNTPTNRNRGQRELHPRHRRLHLRAGRHGNNDQTSDQEAKQEGKRRSDGDGGPS